MRVESAGAESVGQAELLDGLRTSLHGMSQPLTALLFILEYGMSLDAPDEVRMAMASGLEQCERLSGLVRQMQRQVVDSTPDSKMEKGGQTTRWQ